MSTVRSVLAIDFGFADGTDATRIGHTIRRSGAVLADRARGRISIKGQGNLEVVRSPALEKLQSFTLEIEFSPDLVGTPQQVLQGEALPVSVSLEKDGTIVAGVRTEHGWESVTSGERRFAAKEEARVRVIYDERQGLRLEINDHTTGSAPVKGRLQRTGTGGIFIGTGSDGRMKQFNGSVGRVRIRNGAIDAAGLAMRERRADELATRLKKGLRYPGRVIVEPDPDAVDHRFDIIKGILRAAGVQDVSQLSRLTIDRRTVIQPNMIMIAPRKLTIAPVDWGLVANAIATADEHAAVLKTASVLPNRHSRFVLQGAGTSLSGALEASDSNDLAILSSRSGVGEVSNVAERRGAGSALEDEPRAMTIVSRAVPLGLSASSTRTGAASLASIRSAALLNTRTIGEVVRPSRGIVVLDPDIFKTFEKDEPAEWPVQSAPMCTLMSMVTIPINTSVIIAGVLDLTNQQLVIEPSVETLYIIAEEIVGAPNAAITWRRPGGSTPGMADDPSKDGRSYSGVHTAHGSRNGLRGGDGLDGAPGQVGANGIDAPDLEIWVKRLTAMPDIDLNGEDGIKGGRGQRGGRGGNGARGAGGEWWWFFGVHCWKSPGHGGNGGNGGDGGRGGPGGDGAGGGRISIGVLEGTLATSVTARAFKVKNQGGQPGRGGDGGSGGIGGAGGTHGNDYVDGEEVCCNGVDGTHGAQGQPGSVGVDGRAGQDGSVDFFEFTEESWNEQLTRPWLYELTPVQVFPGSTLNITGTRFADTDRVILDAYSLIPAILADESLSVTVPTGISGGQKDIYVRRLDGAESNRLRVWVKPQLEAVTDMVMPGTQLTLRGLAFVAGASVLYDGAVVVADEVTRTTVKFTVPPVGTGVSAERAATFAVRNPDGMTSNARTVSIPCIVDSGLKVDVHGLSFPNFDVGSPSWGTFEDTFGAFEVWHEQIDPLFGHPILTLAFYIFYHEFLKGKGSGGLATGFCTSLSAKVLDEFWTGSNDTFTRISLTGAMRDELTAIHGRLLSRESLIDFHDQGRNGTANVTTSFRRIEQNLRDGGDRESCQMVFFVPSGAAWDEGYFDRLGDSHCIVPYRIVYPIGYDGTSIDGVTLFCWDCNHPFNPANDAARNCRFVFRLTDGEIRYDYFDGGSTTKFRSEDGITLATMTNGKYLLSDHDMPFSGPLGLTTFVIDFLLSPADLLVENASGQRTGLLGTSIVAEIPDSHPCYLVKGAYLLPPNEALTRRITGRANGSYAYHSIAPNGISISLENVATTAGQVDVLASNADGSTLRFTPGASKSFTLNLAREVEGQVRAVTVAGIGGGPATAMDLNLSPDLSIVRISNTDVNRTVDVQVGQIVKDTGANAKLNRNGVALPSGNDLVITVTDWSDLALTVRTLPFE
jgi:hypothetical protein